MRSLSQELLHQVGRAIVVYLLVALLAVGAVVVQALIALPQQAEPDSDEPQISSAPSAIGVRWIDPR